MASDGMIDRSKATKPVNPAPTFSFLAFALEAPFAPTNVSPAELRVATETWAVAGRTLTRSRAPATAAERSHHIPGFRPNVEPWSCITGGPAEQPMCRARISQNRAKPRARMCHVTALDTLQCHHCHHHAG